MITEEFVRNELLFESMETAQDKLDIHYPGLVMKWMDKNNWTIVDQEGKILVHIGMTYIDFQNL